MKTLPFYKDYFKIAYPLPKIDLIALADFAAGKKFCGKSDNSKYKIVEFL